MWSWPTPCALPLGDSAWRQRRPERSVIYGVVQEHLETFLATRDSRERGGLPRFVQDEMRAFLDCGIPARGFLRVRCDGCRHEQILPFSCKGRGFCPSCTTRRMFDEEAHLTETVLPDLPLRQFVFTFPFALRYRLAFDPDLCSAVRKVVMRTLSGFYRKRAQRKNLPAGETGSLAVQQRFGSALNLNIHFHILCFDGVFSAPGEEPSVDFHWTGTPSVADIQRLLKTCRQRLERLLRKRGIDLDGGSQDDPAEQDPELAACLRDAVIDRQRQHVRSSSRPKTQRFPGKVLVAHDQGFSLHADTAIPAHDSSRRSMLVRYLLRPPLAPSQLERTRDGRVSFRLAHPFADGTSHVVWTKDAFLSRLAALVPRPRRHLLTYHGVLAPNHSLRSRVVRVHGGGTTSRRSCDRHRRTPRRTHTAHHLLLLRAYGFMFRRCDRCGGSKRILAVITQPDVIRDILVSLGLDPDPPSRAPPAIDPAIESTFE